MTRFNRSGFVILVLGIWVVLGFALPTKAATFEELFKSGVQLYQENKYEEARAAFQGALEIKKNNVGALVNLASSEYKLGHRGVALGFLRRAQYWQPTSIEAAHLYERIYSEMPVKQIPHRHSFYESLQSSTLASLSLTNLFLIGFLMFMGAGLGLIQFYSKKRIFLKAMETQEAGEIEVRPPVFSWITAVMIFGLLLVMAFTFIRMEDLNTPKGTVIEEKVSVKTAPGENESEVMLLYEGLEVEILKKQSDWVQVYYPGSYAGWIPEKSLLILSDR